MDAFMQMLAAGWPLALVGFAAGIWAGGRLAQSRGEGRRLAAPLKPCESAVSAMQAEIDAVKALLDVESEDDKENMETLKSLDEAIKRANGRLKLLAKAVQRTR